MHRRPEFARIRGVLGRSVHFRELPEADLDALAELGHLLQFKDGDLVRTEAGGHRELWIVLDGSLRLSSVSAEGKEFVYGMLGVGTFFGLGNVLGGGDRSADVHAMGKTTVASIASDPLLALLNKRPHLWRHAAALLHKRVSLAMNVVRDLHISPFPVRLARRLLSYALSAGHQLEAKEAIELRLTQGDLARMLGASRSEVNATLKKLEREGLLEVRYRVVRLLSLPRLRELGGPDIFAF